MLYVDPIYAARTTRRRPDVTLRRAFILRFMDSLATTTMAFVVPVMVYTITHNLAWSGASFMLEWLPRLTAIPLAGPLVDRIGAPRFFVVADSLRAIIVGSAALWLAHSPHAWIAIVLVAIVCGMLAESTFVAAEKLGVEVTGSQPLHHVQAVQVGIDQVVLVLGPVVGGVLMAIDGAVAFLGIFALLLVSGYLAFQLDQTITSPLGTESRSILSGLRSGLHVISKRPALIHVIIGTALYNLLLALLLTITPAIVEQRFHRNTAAVSLAWSLAAAASVIAVWLAARAAKRYSVTTIGFISAMVGCGACLAAGMAQGYWAYVGCLILFLAMDACYAVFIRTARARLVPRAVYGTTVSVIVMLSLVPYPLAGALVAVIPFSHVGQLVTTCTIVTALLSCWSFRAMDHRTLNGVPAFASDAA